MDIDTWKKKLHFRAHHRGFKEADLLIGGFADAFLAGMGEDELDQFERLIAIPDQDLYAWAMGQKPVPDDHDNPMLDRLRQFGYSDRPLTD